MASVKKYNGNLIIQTPFSTGITSNITLDTDFVFITGNLTIQGNTTTVNSNNLSITDNVIVLNRGQTGAGISKGNAGIIIDRGSSPPAQLQYLESLQTWQIATNGTNFANILTATTGNVALTSVFDDKAPVLGGNLNVNGFVLYANTSVNFNGNIGIINTPVIPTTLAGPNTLLIYTTTPSAGQSGIYVINSSVSNEELVTKRRAIGFSLLL